MNGFVFFWMDDVKPFHICCALLCVRTLVGSMSGSLKARQSGRGRALAAETYAENTLYSPN